MPLNIDWKQILLHLFNLVLLFCILFFLLYKPVKDFMDKRLNAYKQADDETKRKLAEAEETRAFYQARLDKADEEIAFKKDEADKENLFQREKCLLEAQKQAEKIVEDAKAAGEEEKQKIVDSARDDIVETVETVCEKMLLSSDVSASFDSFLQEVNGEKND